MTGKQTLGGDEGGFAALVIAITLVVIISLITVGFAQLMRNELNQVTNRQLSNQAYYAAESGINDAAKAITNGYDQAKTACPVLPAGDSHAGSQYLKDNTVGTNAQWTCVLINPTPGNLKYGDVGQVNPVVFLMKAEDTSGGAKNFSTVTFTWQDTGSNTNFATNNAQTSNNAFPKESAWNHPGILRITLTPLPATFDRATMIGQTFTAFLYPTTASNSSNPVAYTSARDQQGQIVNGACAGVSCSATIDLSSLNQGEYVVSLRSIYSDTSVTVNADVNTLIADAQTLVDSTGKAQNVLKRIEVRIPNKNEFYLPGFGVLDAGPICKQLQTYPGDANNKDLCTY